MEKDIAKDILVEDFQSVADEILARNRNILDILSKLQDSASRVNRSTIKSATHCGCLQIEGKKQKFDESAGLADMRTQAQSHVNGELCVHCREHIEAELGATLFYLASLCNSLDINMYDVLLKERERLLTLGKFHMR